MFDKGSGSAIVVVQGLHGRWQWLRPFLESLAGTCRVMTYTLAGDFGADRGLDPAKGFDQYVQQLEGVIARAGVERVALCGISFGGTVAARYAALHPERVTHLVIASSPGPGWRASAQQEGYVARPLLMLPAFLWTSAHRLSDELTAAFPDAGARLRFLGPAILRGLWYPALPWVMARRARLMQTVDLASDCARISAPTLVVTGHPSRDHVVPVDSTRQYLSHIRGSRY